MIGKMYEIVLDRFLVNIPGRSNRCPVVIIDDATQHLSLLNSTTPDWLSTWQRYPLVLATWLIRPGLRAIG